MIGYHKYQVQFPSCLRSNSHLSTAFLKCILDKEKEENGDNDNISLKLTEYTQRTASDHLYIEKRKVRRNRRANSHKVFRSQCVFSNDSFQSFKNSELTAELTEKEKIEFNKDVIIIKRQLQEALKSSGLSTRRRRRNTDFPALKSNDTNHFPEEFNI